MNTNVIIIAEAGINHNGNMATAKQLIDVAKEAGADYVKFQTFKVDKIASRSAVTADYQKKNTGAQDQIAMLKNLELSPQQHLELIDYCKRKEISFFSTPFDEDSIDLLRELNIKLGKIPSGEITNLPYLRKMARSFDSVILSTGMCSMEEVGAAIAVLETGGMQREKISVLHCNTEYPTPFSDVNLRAMVTLAERFKVKVGYSDHTSGIEVAIAAVAMGATIIEKHFTLDRAMEGPDHKASLEPKELKEMVSSIRNIEVALGSSEKFSSASESRNKVIARKSIVAAKDIEEGELFSENNLTVKRPGSGVSPMQWDRVIGQKAKRKFQADELIEI